MKNGTVEGEKEEGSRKKGAGRGEKKGRRNNNEGRSLTKKHYSNSKLHNKQVPQSEKAPQASFTISKYLNQRKPHEAPQASFPTSNPPNEQSPQRAIPSIRGSSTSKL